MTRPTARKWILAASGPYQLAVDLTAAGEGCALGFAGLKRADRDPVLGLPGTVACGENDGRMAAYCRPVLTLGPAYKESDGAWVPLSGVPRDWCDISVNEQATEDKRLAFEVQYRVGGGPTLWESYVLTPDGLEYDTRIEWVVGGFRLHLPVFVGDGIRVGVPECRGTQLALRIGRQRWRAESLDSAWTWELDATPLTNLWGTYQLAVLHGRSALRFAAKVTIE